MLTDQEAYDIGDRANRLPCMPRYPNSEVIHYPEAWAVITEGWDRETNTEYLKCYRTDGSGEDTYDETVPDLRDPLTMWAFIGRVLDWSVGKRFHEVPYAFGKIVAVHSIDAEYENSYITTPEFVVKWAEEVCRAKEFEGFGRDNDDNIVELFV